MTTKIITTTIDDFIKAEVEEWGFDYVDAQFALGYEPTQVNGIWVWKRPNDFSGSDASTTTIPLKVVSAQVPNNSPQRVIRRN